MADNLGQQLGNYRLIKLLGQGGFATVYLAEHVYLRTSAAIKVLQVHLTDAALKTFLAEARTIARLSHPHIIRVLEFGMEQSTPFLVMNYAPYGSLRQRHPSGSLVPHAQILSYVQQVASALQYAHDGLIIHRDVKPENMLLGEAFALMLGDFGLATAVQNQGRDDLPVHHTQSIVGTTTYMAPEQFNGVPSPASDQYALAVAVYEWFCGTPPFKGAAMGVALQHLQTPPPPLREHRPSLSPTIEQVVLRALAKDPRARFPQVRDFAHALEAACASEPASSNDGPGMTPLVLSSVTPLPADSPFSKLNPGAHQQPFASATVANHALAPGSRPFSAPLGQHTESPVPLHHGDTSLVHPPEPQSLSRRKIILGLAGVTGGLVALGAGGVWFELSRNATRPKTTHLPPAASPTPDAQATAQALVNTTISRPSLVALGSGHLDLFVRSRDQALWRRSYDGSWHAWESLGGSLSFDPVAVSWDGQRIDQFMRGADNTLQHRVYDGSWHSWESLGGALASDPTVASWQAGRLDVFVRGAADYALWHTWYDGSWHNWESLGGLLLSSPAVTSWGPNRLDVFVRGADNALWHIAWDTFIWSGWERLGGSFTADPTATSWGPKRLDVFTLGSDETMQHIWYDGSNGSPATWQPWESLSGQLAIAPTAASWGNNRIDLLARDPNQALQHRWFDGSWHSWTLLPTAG
ncbi:MAG TPA: protein kinase [Ktedonobacteraceae bacterium]|jgi:serine/threonine protein kinase